MKKILGLLLSAGMLFNFTACGGDDNGGNDNEGDPGKFSCKVTATAKENKADVTVTPGKNYATIAYKMWVVKKADYKQEVPADAIDGEGTKTQTFEALSYDEIYYAVVYQADMGYKTVEFLTDEATVEYKALQGSNYYLVNMDEESSKLIESKVSTDMRPDDLTVFFDWWNADAFSTGTSTGPNSLGQIAGWMALNVAPATPTMTWFGGAYRLINPEQKDIGLGTVTQEQYDIAQTRRSKLTDIATSDDYVLHMAMKSDAPGNFSLSIFGSGDEDALKVVIGTEADTYGFKRDGAWHEIEIPMSVFKASPKFNMTNVNILALTQGGTLFPKDINLDAVFIYKPAK